jgi:uncharacterized membrane protein YgcG
MNRVAVRMGLGVWILGVLLSGTLAASQPQDLCRIEQEADAIRCLADELRPELRDHFHCSCVFRDLNRSRNDVETAARRVRSAARSRNRVCDLPSDVHCLVESVNRLQCLVDRARGYRQDFGPHGLDRGCVSRVERILAEMCHRATVLEAMVCGGQFGGGYYESGWSGGDWGYGNGIGSGGFAPGPTSYGGVGFSPSSSFPGFAPMPVPVPLATERRVQFGREVERSRSVTRSRDFRNR